MPGEQGVTNIFENIPPPLTDEFVEILAEGRNVRIERIVSQGHASPEKFWYDQDEDEWVVLLKGRATLRFEGDAAPVELGPGDSVNIPAHTRHQVVATADDEPTVWLAVFY